MTAHRCEVMRMSMRFMPGAGCIAADAIRVVARDLLRGEPLAAGKEGSGEVESAVGCVGDWLGGPTANEARSAAAHGPAVHGRAGAGRRAGRV